LVLGVFAGAAVLLTAVGLYGIVAFGVARRTQEIGIRLALGAARASVLFLVLRQTLVIVAVALVLGLAAALAASRLLTSVLWGVTPTDPITYFVVCSLMAVAALIAVLIPARRALAVPPTVALRQD
jgi:putative ABC transport system permease protein